MSGVLGDYLDPTDIFSLFGVDPRETHRTRTVEEDEAMSKKDKPLVERIRAANDVLNRAFEGGRFDAWKTDCWARQSRNNLYADARELLGELAEGLKIRLDVRARDVYRDQTKMPGGDWDKAKDAKLVKVFVVGPNGETGE